MAELEQVVSAITGARFRYHDEDRLQQGITEALAAAGLDPEREVILEPGLGRVDILAGRVAVEVKVAGRPDDVARQIDRYLRSSRVDALVLATIRARHLRLGSRSFEKPVVVVSLANAGL